MYPVLAIAEDILEGHIAKIDCGGICETLYLGMGKGRHAAIVSLVVARADPRYGEVRIAGWRCAAVKQGIGPARSEEHTSELQSLMSISYAVLCLKKKTPYNCNDRAKTKQRAYTV